MAKLIDLIKEHSQLGPVSIEALIRSIGIELDMEAELESGISGQIAKVSEDRYKNIC